MKAEQIKTAIQRIRALRYKRFIKKGGVSFRLEKGLDLSV
jgi:hypothetical protein